MNALSRLLVIVYVGVSSGLPATCHLQPRVVTGGTIPRARSVVCTRGRGYMGAWGVGGAPGDVALA